MRNELTGPTSGRVHVRLPQDIFVRVQAIVTEHDVPASEIVRMALQRSMTSIERTLAARARRAAGG